MADNYGRKVVDSRGGHFRIVSGDPRVGRDGPETFKIYGSNDNGEVFLIAHGHGSGLGRIACDKSIEIHAGDKNDPNNVDIRISATTGDITINADRGRVRVNAKDIMMTADSVAEMIEWVIELEDNTQMRTLSFDVGNFDG